LSISTRDDPFIIILVFECRLHLLTTNCDNLISEIGFLFSGNS